MAACYPFDLGEETKLYANLVQLLTFPYTLATNFHHLLAAVPPNSGTSSPLMSHDLHCMNKYMKQYIRMWCLCIHLSLLEIYIENVRQNSMIHLLLMKV